MKIFLVRHGETISNVEKRYCGLYEAQLTDKGIKQAEKLKEDLRGTTFQKIYLSCTHRCKDTADIICSTVDKIQDERLNELNFGIFDNKTYDEIQKKYPEECEEWQKSWKEYIIPQGESVVQAFERVTSFMKELENNPGENVLIVTHGGIIRLMYCYILDSNIDLYWKFASYNGGLSILSFEYNNWIIEKI